MSTSAVIEIPLTSKKFYVSADGYPDEMIGYIQTYVERAVSDSKDEYKNPEEGWKKELKNIFFNLTEGSYSELNFYDGRSMTNYRYKVTEDGEILMKETGNDQYELVETFETPDSS